MRILALLSLCSLVAARPATATTLDVPSATYPTIQSALNDTEVGDTVLVAPGTYTGAENRDLRFFGRDVVLVSVGGPGVTLIDCEEAGRGFTFIDGESLASQVIGFTVTHGAATGAGGAFFFSDAEATVINCRMTDNHGAPGGAVSVVSGAEPQFLSCHLEGNQSAEAGGAIHVSFASSGFTYCVIRGNRSELTGGGAALYSNGFTQFVTCLVTGNAAPDGAGLSVRFGATSLFFGGTLAGNEASGRGGAVWTESGFLSVSHSILWANCAASGPTAWVDPGSTLDLACSFYDNTGVGGSGTIQVGSGNSTEDPLFCLASACGGAPNTGGDYGLMPSSPARSSVECGVIGALHDECEDTPVLPTTWGLIKNRFGVN